METHEKTYEQAIEYLDTIIRSIEKGELTIDSLSLKLQEAKELIKFCREKLYATDEQIKQLLAEE